MAWIRRYQADGKVFGAGAGMGWWAETVAEKSVTLQNSRRQPVERVWGRKFSIKAQPVQRPQKE